LVVRRGEVKNTVVLLTYPQELSLIGTSHMTCVRCHVTSNIYNNAILTVIFTFKWYNVIYFKKFTCISIN
jgi:hypothetical protein